MQRLQPSLQCFELPFCDSLGRTPWLGVLQTLLHLLPQPLGPGLHLRTLLLRLSALLVQLRLELQSLCLGLLPLLVHRLLHVLALFAHERDHVRKTATWTTTATAILILVVTTLLQLQLVVHGWAAGSLWCCGCCSVGSGGGG